MVVERDGSSFAVRVFHLLRDRLIFPVLGLDAALDEILFKSYLVGHQLRIALFKFGNTV